MSITLDKKAAYDYIREANQTAQGVNPWNQLYGAVSANSLAQAQSKTADYSSLLSQAYAQSKNTTSAFEASPYGEGVKQYMIDENNAALKQAYESYKQNYLTDIASIQDTVDKQVAAIDTELDKQADKSALLGNSVYDYLTALYDEQYSLDDKSKNLFVTDENYKKYLTADSLKSKEELMKTFYDKNGNINIAGTDFYDQMFNQQANEKRGLSYDEWLYNQNTDKDSDYYGLYDWASSDSLYDWSPNVDGTKNMNISSFKKMVGMSSDDEKYTFIERWGGMNKEQVQNMFSKYQTQAENLQKEISNYKGGGKKGKELQSSVSSYIAELKSLAKQLGIQNDLGEDYWTKIEKVLSNDIKDPTSRFFSEVGEKALSGSLVGAGTGAAVSAMIGGLIGTVFLPGIGTAAGAAIGTAAGAAIGAAGGAVVGGIGGTVTGSIEDDKIRKENVNNLKTSSSAYIDAVTVLVAYAEQQRAKSQNRQS